MKNMTIRGIDETLDHALRTAAEKESRSINQFVLDLLKAHLGLTKAPRHTRKHDDLDDLFGRWSAAEYERIQGMVDQQRKVDAELWS